MKTLSRIVLARRRCWRAVLAVVLIGQFPARADQIIYNDSLQNGWQDWSWATVNFTNTSPVHSGTDSISVTAGAWTAMYVHASGAFDPSGFTNLSFWIDGGSAGGQLLQVQATYNGSAANSGLQIPALGKSWQQINAPMSVLIPAGQSQIDGFWIQDRSGTAQPTFYVDDITLQSGPPVPPTTNTVATVQVDAQANRHAISPLIYGVAFALSNDLTTLNFTLNRSGGNSETRYNWQINAHNLANDWYFESYADSSAVAGASADDHVANSEAAGAQPMITIPMIGWMPKLAAGRGIIPSYSVAKYGAQTATDPYLADAGNGVALSTGLAITNNDPNDANFPTNAAFQQTFVQHLLGRWGASTNGGVRYYIMDNEHSIWFSTHQDVHPIGPTMQEILGRILDYASMVKSNDPNALVCGPEEFGWSGYFFSGYDQQWSGQHGDYNTSDYPDRAANGGWDYLPWLLNQLHEHDTNTGRRLLDCFTLHCYPQGAEGGDDVTVSTELLRNESTRQFWDTNYVDQSWIGQQPTNNILMLIPRMKGWVNQYYPGTKIGITEYNWGAEAFINGATAQADILGIFGREGLDLATRWETPAADTPTYLAMKIYRNYDGNDSAFGDTSVSATVADPDNVSAFAAIRTNDSALTVMVINKTLSGFTPLALAVTNFANSGTAQAWQITSSNVLARLADIPYAGGTVSNTLPAQSITLLVLPTVKALRLRTGTNAPAQQFELWTDGQGGQQYTLQSSTNLVSWAPVSTNWFATNSFRWLLSTTNGAKMFYRAQLDAP